MQNIIEKCLKEANEKNYNIIDYIDMTTFFIPFKKNHPHIIKQSGVYFLFYLEKDINFSDKLLELIKIGDVEDFIYDNIDDFYFDQNRKFNLFKIKEKKSELFFHVKDHNINDIVKHYILDNKSGCIIKQFDLLNRMNDLPINKIKTENGFNEKYYHLSYEGKMTLSFHHHQDKPFEITESEGIITKDYLIPYLKERRTAFYKPSSVSSKDGKLISFEYIVNKIDKTIEAKKLLEDLNINNPEHHTFKDDEIYLFKKLFNC